MPLTALTELAINMLHEPFFCCAWFGTLRLFARRSDADAMASSMPAQQEKFGLPLHSLVMRVQVKCNYLAQAVNTYKFH